MEWIMIILFAAIFVWLSYLHCHLRAEVLRNDEQKDKITEALRRIEAHRKAFEVHRAALNRDLTDWCNQQKTDRKKLNDYMQRLDAIENALRGAK